MGNRFQCLPALVESSWDMETAFPLSTFQVKDYFPLTVQVTPPLGVFGIFKVFPRVVVHPFEPVEALLVAC